MEMYQLCSLDCSSHWILLPAKQPKTMSDGRRVPLCRILLEAELEGTRSVLILDILKEKNSVENCLWNVWLYFEQI